MLMISCLSKTGLFLGHDPTFSAGYSGPAFGRAAELFQNPSSNEREAILLREIEKEKIRRELIAGEILRKRVLLEEEVTRRRDMMLVAALCRPHEGFSLSSAWASDFGPRVSVLESRAIKERLAFSYEERLRGYRNRSGMAGFEMVPFQRIPERRISEIKVIESSLEVTKSISKYSLSFHVTVCMYDSYVNFFGNVLYFYHFPDFL